MGNSEDSMRLFVQPLPYNDQLDLRDPASISMIVIHCTELPQIAMARQYAEQIHYAESKTGNAGHYYIDRDGTVIQYVSDNRVAHHVKGHNEHSIGIELVNLGRYPNWFDTDSQDMTQPYPEQQIEALIRLIGQLKAQYPAIQTLAGHADLDTLEISASNDSSVRVRRKLDPGPLFPWDRVVSASGLDPWSA